MHPIHPMVVHFPIALLLASTLFDALAFRWRSQQFRETSLSLLILGILAAGVAVLTGHFAEEAVDTLQGVVDAYAVKGDDKSKDMHYWQGRALEAKGDMDLARKRYSQVAMWEFTFRDVQQRLKAVRESAKQ